VWAAHLIAAGQDALVIAKRLGHASVSLTYDKYGHLMAKADSEQQRPLPRWSTVASAELGAS
jgi:integrase